MLNQSNNRTIGVGVASAPEPLTAADVAEIMSSTRYRRNGQQQLFDRKPAPPSALKRFFDQRIMPAAIDGAACLDMGLLKTAEHMRRNPAMALGVVTGMGVLLAVVAQTARARKR